MLLGRRLVFFALAQRPDLVSFETSTSWLLDDDGHWLWSTSAMREVMRLLVSLGPILTVDHMQRLQDAIVKGPPRTRFRDDISDDDFERFSDRMRWLRLKKLLSNGGTATENAHAFMASIEEHYSEWELATDEREEFPMWSSNGADIVEEQLPRDFEGLVARLREKPSVDDLHAPDNWAKICKDNSDLAMEVLKKLSEDDHWYPQRWEQALYAWANDENNSRTWQHIAPALVEMPDSIFAEAVHAISWWVSRISKNVGEHVEEFFTLVDRIIDASTTTVEDFDDFSLIHVMNHPVGHAASSLLNWWFSMELEDDQELPDELSDRFAKMCKADSQPLWIGSVILAQQVIPLLRVDQDWTKQYLIPSFEWAPDVTKAAAIWDSFLHAPRIYLPLLELLKSPFLEVPDHIDDLKEQCLEQYARFLTYIALSEASVFSSSELKEVFTKLTAEYLETVAETLFRALQSSGEQQEEYLTNRVIPFVNSFWPSKPEARAPETFRYFAQMAAVSRNGFEEAFACFKNHLGQTAEFSYLLHLLEDGGLAADHPSEILSLLNATIPQDVPYLYGGLGPLLDIIQGANPALSNHPHFNRLTVLSQQHED